MRLLQNLVFAIVATFALQANAEMVNNNYAQNIYLDNANNNQGIIDFSDLMTGFDNPVMQYFDITFYFTDDNSDLIGTTTSTTDDGSYTDRSSAYDCSNGGGAGNCGWVYYDYKKKTTTTSYATENASVDLFGDIKTGQTNAFDNTVYTGQTNDYRYDDYYDDDHYTRLKQYTQNVGASGSFSISYSLTNTDWLKTLNDGTLDYSLSSEGDLSLTSISIVFDAHDVPALGGACILLVGFMLTGRRKEPH